MSRSLKRLSPSLLGLLGGGLGLVFVYQLAGFLTSLSACSCGWNPADAIVVGPVVVGSVFGIMGGAFYLLNRTAGGAMLLAGGLVVSSATFFQMFLFGLLLIFLAPNLFFGLLLLLGGLLAFPKTRHLLRMLHEGGWIP